MDSNWHLPVTCWRCCCWLPQVQAMLEAGPGKDLDGFLDRWGGRRVLEPCSSR